MLYTSGRVGVFSSVAAWLTFRLSVVPAAFTSGSKARSDGASTASMLTLTVASVLCCGVPLSVATIGTV